MCRSAVDNDHIVTRFVDFFDALTHKRPYRPAWAVEKTIVVIGDESGGHFDPAVVKAMLAIWRAGIELPLQERI